jgi:hypothetical protein
MTNNLYYSGSVSTNNPSIDALINIYDNEYPVEYPIDFNIMDLVRFDKRDSAVVSTSLEFVPQNEFIIIDVDKSFTPYRFKVDRPVDSSLMDDNNRINRYVFSKRVEDETNIVINYKKNPGPTSGGIVKNVNILPSINDKLGNIVSDLKNKIFSTVLTS